MVIDGRHKLEQGGYTAIKGRGKKKITSLRSHIKLSFSTLYRFFVFSPSGVHTSLPESLQYVSDSLLIGGTEKKKKKKKTIGMCVHMDPNGSDPGGMCQFTQNQTPEANVCIKRTTK